MSYSSLRHRGVWFSVFTAALAGGWWAGRSALTSPAGPLTREMSPVTAQRLKPRVEPGSAADRWVKAVKNATGGQFPDLFDALAGIFPPDEDHDSYVAAQRFLLGTWISRDAEAALAFVIERKSSAELVEHAAKLMGLMEPEKMIELMGKPEATDLPERFADTALEEVARVRPELYLRFDPKGDASRNPWRLAVKQLTLEAPLETVAAWFSRKPDPTADFDTNLLITTGSAWQTRDSAGARRWAEGLASESGRRIALHGWLSSLARTSPRAALDALAEMGHEFGGDSGTPSPGSSPVVESWGDSRLDVAGQLARQDFSSALQEAQRIADSFPRKDYDATHSTMDRVRQWMAKAKIGALPDDPAGLLAGLDEMTHAAGGDAAWWREVQTEVLAEKIAGWTREDCLTALGARLKAGVNDPVVPVLLERAAGADPHAMLEALPGMALDLQAVLARAVFFALPREEQEQRRALLERWPAVPWTPELTKSLQGEEADYAPVLANGTWPGEVRATFAEQWAETDPAAAAAWVSDLPPQAGGRAEETGAVARAWAGQDEAEASAWVDTLPQGVERDAAAAALVNALAPFNPEAARQWALSIQNEGSRGKALKELEATLTKPVPEPHLEMMMQLSQPFRGAPAKNPFTP